MRAGRDIYVSARMLYEMAKRHDEWHGEGYSGSSLRGAIHGWKFMGVCSEKEWKYYTNPSRRGNLTVKKAKDARNNTLGTYYRLRPVISDYHSALNEAGVIVVSAKVHQGWKSPVDGFISQPDQNNVEKNNVEKNEKTGGHAFTIVGYNNKGFWVQNSWGPDWGSNGLALWTYEDWINNIMDGWVFRLALPTPQIFGLMPVNSILYEVSKEKTTATERKPSIKRDRIAGHFVHINNGKFVTKHRYWSTRFDVRETAKLIAESSKYRHVLFIAHGGLNSLRRSTARIAAMKDIFKVNKIYPYHIFYDAGLIEELREILSIKGKKALERVGHSKEGYTRVFEKIARLPGRLLWSEIKKEAHNAFLKHGAGTKTLKIFFEHLESVSKNHRKKIHFVAHSTGAILFLQFLYIFNKFNINIETFSLMAPACSIKHYHETLLPVLMGKTAVNINRMDIYNLRDELEQHDTVLSPSVYPHSLLYLISNAFERNRFTPLLGMEKFYSLIQHIENKPTFHFSDAISGKTTRSRSHDGFNIDIFTMNSILSAILGGPPDFPFKASPLKF
jgi:hypothetical protein